MDNEEYEGLKRYLKLEILENCKVINEQEQEEIEYLTKFDSVRDLVESHKKLEKGLISEEEFNALHDKYRFFVANPEEEFSDEDLDLIRNEVPTYKDGDIKRSDLDEIVSKIDSENDNGFEKKYEELAEYFSLLLEKDNGSTDEIAKRIKELSNKNEMVERLEKASLLFNEGKIAKESYYALLSFYRSELEEVLNP